MLMYTSCGWFFDDLAGIETVQIMSYAARCLQLAQEIFGHSLESDFLEILGRARSNRTQFGDGRQIYQQLVKPLVFDLAKVGVHYGAGALFNDYPEQAKIYCYTAENHDHQSYETGTAKLIFGKTRITSDITRESSIFGYVVLHLGNHNLTVGVKKLTEHSSYAEATKELTAAFASTDLTQTIRVLDKRFAGSTYNLMSLFADEQRKILELVLQNPLEEAEAAYRQLYEHHGPLLRFLKEASGPPPKALYTAAEFVLNADLQRAFEDEELNLARIEHLLREARLEGISLETTSLEFGLRKTIERLAAQLAANPSDFGMLQELEDATTLVSHLPFEVDLWKVQNVCYEMLQIIYGEYQIRAQQGQEEARSWLRHFNTIAHNLTLQV